MNKLACSAILLASVIVAGCMTEKTRLIVADEDTEMTAGISEADLRRVVSAAVQDIDRASMRYAKPDARRIVNVKPFTVDTTARGSQAGYLADSLKLYFEEELMNGEKFVVYNEEFAARTGSTVVRPEFVLTGKLREQNVRRDNGNVYKEYALLLKLTDVATTLDFWQKRVPLQKAVDKTNVMN